MNGRNGPLSPVSVGGSEWSGISKYNNLDAESPYSPIQNTRGQLATPPMSSGSNGVMNGNGYRVGGSIGGSPGGPSPPNSIARSSVGTGLYVQSDGGRSKKEEQLEATLAEHYAALKNYLSASLKDEKGNSRPTRARDKLLRLSLIPFQELSTDVFDELVRRKQAGRTPGGIGPGGPPPFLLPKDSFHPKRNQARQKLSSLPATRFQDLATDVFYELERRFPRFSGKEISRMGSPATGRGPPSRNGTPMDGNRAPSRTRRPSESSSAAGYSIRSDSRNGPRNGPSNGNLGISPASGLSLSEYGRPTPKTFQSNTMVPNKSTMVEDDGTGIEDNDDDDGDAFGLESVARSRESKKSAGSSETDKKLLDDYQSQVAELREKLDTMEDRLKQKDDELNNVLDAERARASSANLEKNEWSAKRLDLEARLADAQNLNQSMQEEIDRVQASKANSEREIRAQLEELKASSARSTDMGNGRLELDNQELRKELKEQQQVTDEVRREAQGFLREMRTLSERSGLSYEKEQELMNTISRLEEEVQDWRNRYARTKTQLRSLRASSIGLTIGQDASKYMKDSGFTERNGLVKDVHVTKFQISIDELLRVARADDPARVIEFMKSVIQNVRRITQDIDEAPPSSGEIAAQQVKLKSRVSATANNLITASRNFASASGISPVSLLDAAASHLTTAVVELVRTVKVRPTPAGELEDDDDGNLEPVDTTGFFPVREARQETSPPPFLGLRNGRVSQDSSMYSPVNSPRESAALTPKTAGKESWAGRQRSLSRPTPMSSTPNGTITNKALPLAPMGVGFGIRTQESNVEELKVYLEDQTALLVQNIQSLVSSIRSETGITAISSQIDSIANVVSTIISSTATSMSSTGNGALRSQGEPILKKLSNCRQKLLDAGEKGRAIANEAREDEEGDRAWRAWNQSLPPIAFEIARETKELMLRVDAIDGEQDGPGGGDGAGDDDFS